MSSQTKSAALSVDLNNFIYGVSRRNFQNAPELTKIGILLLKNFPAARDAVLEYFAMVFHDAVNVSINQGDYESDSSANGSLESVTMIGPELCSLGESWAPFIAPWCINLIMDIATDKANLPNATLQTTEPVRVLLDITTQNLTMLNSEERAKCIDMMLGCRACSWAVGWVGRAEPALVAPRALALGADAARAVLAHLANHPPALFHVRAAIVELFQEAIKEDGQPDKKREVIPYLLNLASKSDIVLKALTQDIENTLTDEVLERLGAVCAAHRHSGAWEGVGPASLVTLLLRSDVHCLFLLLKHAQRNVFSRQLLEYLLQKLEYECLFPDRNMPLLTSAAEEIATVRERLLTGNQLEQYSLARILILVGSTLPSEFVSTISYLLQYSRNDTTLALLVRIISGCRACSWAVGWVGRAEPALVAPRALALGADAARAVLAHLANHPPALFHVRAAIVELFQEAIKEDGQPDKKREVIPYLLNLASKSDIVLKALTQDIENTLTDEVLERLGAVCAAHRHSGAWEGVGPASLVTLLLRSDVHCLFLLLKHAQRNVFSRQLLEYLLQKLEYECLFPDRNMPLLTSAAEEIATVRERLLTGNQLEQYSLARILILVGSTLPSEFVSTISYLLQYSRNDTTLALLVRIISGTITMHTPNDSTDISTDTERYQNLIKTGVEYALREAMMSDTQIKKYRHAQSAEAARELSALSELLSVMTLGQLLPHPLSHMLELAPELTASELVQVLRDCLWNYTRDHVPSPALFTCDSSGLHWRDPSTCKPPSTYTDTLRLIIQKRISKLGHLYPIMFLNLDKEN
ncbi:hypothetical protein RR48_09979 [Papilio machaon]|uniref:Integrator complex subunit 5 n=1 Tax=Papilio machaon TaxID=76193 RepID=A0A194RDL5_PAPMA|nr:hypothetical protein RR48_09979 [Papilio machaon]